MKRASSCFCLCGVSSPWPCRERDDRRQAPSPRRRLQGQIRLRAAQGRVDVREPQTVSGGPARASAIKPVPDQWSLILGNAGALVADRQRRVAGSEPPDPTARGGCGRSHPLGARALYLFRDGRDALYRIHGTNEPDTIGEALSSGCTRMINQDVIDLCRGIPTGTKVVVLPA